MYMELPPGIKTKHENSKDYFLKLLRTCTVRNKLEEFGTRLFFGSNDDTLFLIIKKLQESGLNIEDQGHPPDYIGVNIKKTCDGTYLMTSTLVTCTPSHY
eukprot:CCRYP_013750-RA/>CCRYP_013750-RA protein AED:0.43 eAED:0.35 QI:35/0/0/1/0/0/2/0/99